MLAGRVGGKLIPLSEMLVKASAMDLLVVSKHISPRLCGGFSDTFLKLRPDYFFDFPSEALVFKPVIVLADLPLE